MSTSKPGDFDYPGVPGEGAVANITTDFNLDDEYKADPIVPAGTYFANVTKEFGRGGLREFVPAGERSAAIKG